MEKYYYLHCVETCSLKGFKMKEIAFYKVESVKINSDFKGSSSVKGRGESFTLRSCHHCNKKKRRNILQYGENSAFILSDVYITY